MLVVKGLATRTRAGSRRPSYHGTPNVPVTGSTAAFGLNIVRLASLTLSASESLSTWPKRTLGTAEVTDQKSPFPVRPSAVTISMLVVEGSAAGRPFWGLGGGLV